MYMAESHAELDRLIGQVSEAEDDDERAGLFGKFKSKLEKHMLTEEQSIFSLDDLAGGSIVEVVRRLYKDHKKMKSEMEAAEDDIKNRQIPKLTGFIQLLFGHHRLEDETLYPYLDHHLPPGQKDIILREIRSNLD